MNCGNCGAPVEGAECFYCKVAVDLPKTPAGRIEMLHSMLTHVDEYGNPQPLITPEDFRRLLEAPGLDP